MTHSDATAAPSKALDLSLLVLRVALGAIFIAHGGQKLFWSGLSGTTQSFETMGVPLAALAGPLVTFVELFGGLALVAGLFTRVAAGGIAVTMTGAILFVHLSQGFFAPQGIEFPMINLAVAVALVLVGPGAWSLDAQRVASRAQARAGRSG